MANLGFVGLGVMGSRMAERLIQKGHSLTGYNRTRAKAQFLIDKGMKWADSPRAVAAASEVTFSSVANSAALLAITEGPDGILAGLSKGKTYVDMSTVSVSTSRGIAAKVREKGADMMDSPVSGTVATLMQGKLSLMVGGKKETFERLKPLFEDFSRSSGHRPRAQGHLRGREWAGAGNEDCHQLQPGGADAGVFGSGFAGGKERDRAPNRRRRADA